MQGKNFIPATLLLKRDNMCPKYRHIVSPYVQGDNICSHTPYHLPVVQSDTMGGISDETANAEPSCYSRCDMIKIPFCSKVIGIEHRPCKSLQLFIGNGNVFIWMQYFRHGFKQKTTNKYSRYKHLSSSFILSVIERLKFTWTTISNSQFVC